MRFVELMRCAMARDCGSGIGKKGWSIDYWMSGCMYGCSSGESPFECVGNVSFNPFGLRACAPPDLCRESLPSRLYLLGGEA
jgi:hypothetical protein